MGENMEQTGARAEKQEPQGSEARPLLRHRITLTPSNYTVYAGAYNLSGANSHEVKVKVKNFIINPNYTTFTKGSDICLMELQTELNFTQYISPVCLPASGVAFPTGLPCWVTGWGNIARNVSLPPPKTLQEVLVPLIGAQVCKSYYSRVANITDNMICAGYVSGGKGICQGDSGGPLVCAQADRWYLVGIVSFGIPCEQKYYPSVYGRSNAFVDWITTLVPEVSPNVLNIHPRNLHKTTKTLRAKSNFDLTPPNFAVTAPNLDFSAKT
ncbi:prostasin-like [Xenopus tropicalis]|uniref:Prostasin-like n=1 Tax=Xenopus tropicalis TaxID=8364 RepID=A0A8J1IUF4_XENTR|nr:prostasin-like [Xenopus tropicalis]